MNQAHYDHYRGGGQLPKRLANALDQEEEKGVSSIAVILGVPLVLMLVIALLVMSGW